MRSAWKRSLRYLLVSISAIACIGLAGAANWPPH
jgi:hypothetical protein